MLAGVRGDGSERLTALCPGWIVLEDSTGVGSDGQLDLFRLAGGVLVDFSCSSDCLRRESLSLSFAGEDDDPSMIAALQPGG